MFEHKPMTDHERLKWLTAVVVFISGVLLSIGAFMLYSVATEEEPYDPISFVNPALIQFSDGSVPTVNGLEGPAVMLGEPGEQVLPLLWFEQNAEQEPVGATFSSAMNSFGNGVTVTLRAAGTPRPSFAPGVTRHESLIAFSDEVREEVETFANQGNCVTSWVRTGTATPVAPNAVTADFFTENFWIVHPCYFEGDLD